VYIGLNYIPHNTHAKSKVKATLGYNETRVGKDGAEIERQLFGKSGPLTKVQAEKLLETASENTYFYRMKLSPDPNGENAEKTLDLWELTRDAVRWLEERLERRGEIGLIGAEHDDHTEIAHIHAILLIERRGREKILTKDDINEFREAVGKMALEKKLNRQLAVEREEAQHQETQVGRQEVYTGVQLATPEREARIIHEPVQKAVYGLRRTVCLICRGDRGRELTDAGVERCPGCGRELGRRKEATLALSR
jgi:hypothetical protein